jgi:RimJ/RimL family protein N-acetyltransferase
MKMSDNIEVLTSRFYLRTLNLSDDLEKYLSWMQDVGSNPFIMSARSDYTMNDLKIFINQVNSNPEITLFGIFDRKSNMHIGNIKFSQINATIGSVEVGILIGQKEWRNKGVGQEVMIACNQWLKRERLIQKVVLGVDTANIAAINLYKKLGFKQIEHACLPMNALRMELLL